MTVHLKLSHVKKTAESEAAKLHFMPCVIKKNGEAKVSSYFEPVITKRNGDDGVLMASFRGYPLLGRELVIPSSYTGIVLQDKSETIMSESEKTVYGSHSFDRFTYWNWDVEPSENDKVAAAMDWFDVAEALHAPVES